MDSHSSSSHPSTHPSAPSSGASLRSEPLPPWKTKLTGLLPSAAPIFSLMYFCAWLARSVVKGRSADGEKIQRIHLGRLKGRFFEWLG